MAKKKSKKTIIWLIILFVVVLSVVLGVVFKQGNGAINVQASKVERRTITQSVSAVGKIQPETEIKISSETSGEIIYLGVKEGDTVRVNQLLVRIKPDIIEMQLEQLQAASDASKMQIEISSAEKERTQSELQRITELYKKKFSSQQELDRAKAAFDQAVSGYKASLARYEQAQASYKEVKRSAERTTIYSPIDGIVTALNVEKGEKVVGTAQMQGTEMMRISDLNIMNAVIDVDENDIVLVKRGDTAEVEIDAIPDIKYRGVVFEMGHSAKVNSLGTQDQVTNFEVKVRLLDKEPRLRPGMSCNVDVNTETRYNVLSVPLQAVTVRDTSERKFTDLQESDDEVKAVKSDKEAGKKIVSRPPSVVFVMKGDKAVQTKVDIGISDKGYIEVIKGLKDKEEIISGSFEAVSKTLHDGAKIKVENISKTKKDKK